MAQKELYPVLKISVKDQQPSGYFREDTIGSPNPIQKTAPGAFYIPNEGNGIRFIKVSGNDRDEIDSDIAIKTLKEELDGYQNIIPEPYPIRFIKGCPSIDREWQEEHNWKPRTDPKADEIVIEDGYAEFEYSVDPSKYRYLKSIMYNEDVPFRQAHILPLFYEVKENTKAVLDIHAELAISEAMKEWEKLVNMQADRSFTLNEQKINGYSELLNIQGLNTTERLRNLLVKVKQDPIGFVEKVKAYKESTITDVTHASDLQLVKYEGNVAVFQFNGKRVDLGRLSAKTSKPERLAELLKTAEYAELYITLKSQIELAKESQLN